MKDAAYYIELESRFIVTLDIPRKPEVSNKELEELIKFHQLVGDYHAKGNHIIAAHHWQTAETYKSFLYHRKNS